MISAPRNNMATPFRVRDDVGPHQHEWVVVGRDAMGEEYQQCRICDARRCVTRPRFEASRQDWLNYREDWAPATLPESEPTPDPVVADEPVKRKAGRPRKNA